MTTTTRSNHRIGRSAVTIAAALVCVGATACSSDEESNTVDPATTTTATDTTDTTAAPTTVPPATTTPATTAPSTPSTTEPAAVIDVRVYFLSGERLTITHSDVEGPAVLRGALESLLDGPAEDGLTTAIPAGTRVRGVNLDDGTATVDLTGEFDDGGGSASMQARVGQVVFTATQFDNVERVVFWIDGSPIEFLGGEGLVMSDPWTRSDVPREFTGGILIDEPRPGDTVSAPFEVTGEADVFEGDFPIEIRRDGAVVAVIAPVSAGAWGDWDDFSATIDIEIAPGPFELVAYDDDGCGDGPECPPVIEIVVPLILR